METKKQYLAIDFGASSGRHMLGWNENGKYMTEEVYRFVNGNVEKDGALTWDVDALFDSVIKGLKVCGERGILPESIGIDTWGVDYVLLDKDKKRIGNAFAYRDSRTEAVIPTVHSIVPQSELYERTGIQFQPFNTIYQLYADKISGKLDEAEYFLMIPDYFNFLLTGVINNEYTNASTTGLINLGLKTWDYDVIDALGLPRKLFKQPNLPPFKLGKLLPEIAEKVGFSTEVISVASHDTASAVVTAPDNEKCIYISSGTWSLMGIKASEPHSGLLALEGNFSNEGGINYIRFLKNITGLWMIQSVKRESKYGYSFDELVELARKSNCDLLVDVNSPVFLAPKDGMENAVKKECMRTLKKCPEDLGDVVRVIYRSLAKSYFDTAKQLEKITGKTFDSIYIMGGGRKDTFLNELAGIYTGKNIILGDVEATSIGNIMIQEKGMI